MVDVDSAMRASAYSGKRRGRKSEDEKKEEKQSRELEPFDPVEHEKKERVMSSDVDCDYLRVICSSVRSVLANADDD